MRECVVVKPLAVCAAILMAATLLGCSRSAHLSSIAAPALVASTPSPQPAPPAGTPSDAIPAGVDSACEHAPLSPRKLTGDWTEPGDTTVTTLSDDGTLRSSGEQSGTWTYAPWAATPGKASM